MKKAGWALAALALVGAAGFYYIRGREAGEEAKFRTEPVGRGDVALSVTATGTISAVTTVQVGSQVSGIIARLHADFNSRVRRGQLLAELDPTPFEARVEQRRADVLQAEVQLRRTQLDHDRQRRLLTESLASQAEYDAAKAAFDAAGAQVDQAAAGLRQAQTDLAYTKINSPIDGVVVARQYDVGQTVAASFQAPTLFTIAQDLTKMQVQADVDQSDIGRIEVGQAARFTVDAYPDEEFRARISQIRLNATVNQNVITYPVILAVDNSDEKLRPQMTADVSVEVARVKDVLRVPNAALRFRPLGAGPGAERQAASPGARSDGATGGSPRGPAGAGGERKGRREGTRRKDQAADGARNDPHAGESERDEEGAEGPPAGRSQAVFVLDGAGNPRRIAVRTGISDGRFTQIVSGELSEGDAVVTGQATARMESPSPFGGAGGGGGRFGGGRGF